MQVHALYQRIKAPFLPEWEAESIRRGSLVATILALVAALTTACATGSPSPTPSPTPPPARDEAQSFTVAKVVDVIDGVTIDVEIDGQVFRVRYLGVEVPEVDPQGASGPTLSARAFEFNRFHLKSGTVEMERDSIDMDTAGRLLRYVYVNGEMVNMALLTSGYAAVATSPPEFKHRNAFDIAEEIAKSARSGVWSPRASSADVDASLPGPSPSQPFGGGTLPQMPGPLGSATACDYSETDEPVIKGNIEPRTGEQVYHVPGGFFYSTTVISASDGDRWFCTEEEAMAAGWKRSKR
jgi:micrococcal nuclease